MMSRAFLLLLAIVSAPQTLLADTGERASSAGVSGVWVLANFCYAGMRAQASSSSGWRVISFIFGFLGTLLSMLVIDEGGERAYGVDLPRADRSNPVE